MSLWWMWHLSNREEVSRRRGHTEPSRFFLFRSVISSLKLLLSGQVCLGVLECRVEETNFNTATHHEFGQRSGWCIPFQYKDSQVSPPGSLPIYCIRGDKKFMLPWRWLQTGYNFHCVWTPLFRSPHVGCISEFYIRQIRT
jgi:hypothetical protein